MLISTMTSNNHDAVSLSVAEQSATCQSSA